MNVAIRNTALENENTTQPEWLLTLLEKGYEPYIATSRHLIESLNTAPFSYPIPIHLLDDENQIPFYEAYLLSNSLSFASPDLKMPHWVMIDCALMQSAIVGFTRTVEDLPPALLKYYEDDPRIDLSKLSRIPVSGQIASPATTQGSFVGISLFSLGQMLGDDTRLGLYTKALALETYRARQNGTFYGIAQYDNPALKIHGRFSSKMEIEQATVPLHPRKDMTLIYKMTIDFDPYTVEQPPSDIEPTFWLNANDKEMKLSIQEGLRQGRRYQIAPPFAVKRDGAILLPIIEEN
jgi:hypothetical protein